jgi:hypothetical protein
METIANHLGRANQYPEVPAKEDETAIGWEGSMNRRCKVGSREGILC